MSTTVPSSSVSFDYFTSADTAAGKAPGKLKKITGPDSVDLSYEYIGSLLSKTSWTNHSGSSLIGSVGWTYDSDFNAVTQSIVATTGSSSASFSYDLDHFITCACSSSSSGCTTTPKAADALVVGHDTNGSLTTLVQSGVTETYAFTNFGELAQKKATATGASSTVFAQFDYEPATGATNRRDALGRVTQRLDKVLSASSTTYNYSYSPEGWLTDVTDGGTTVLEHYTYDTNGNRKSANIVGGLSVTTSQTDYDPQDRLNTYGIYSYTYSDHGRLQTKTNASTTVVTTYSYDTLGNLLSVTPSSGSAIGYTLDGQNRRVAKLVASSVSKRWLYRDGLKPVAELDNSGALVSTFVYASNSNIPDYMVRSGNTYRILSDQLGSPRLIINVANSSDVPFNATYSAFGVQTMVTGSADYIPFGFAGGLYDPDTGLVRFGARDYDPVVGRWISKDPILFRGRQANLYVYVNNDPVNRRDARGLTDWGPLGGHCCNTSPAPEMCLVGDGQSKTLGPGECTGFTEDCDGMTCGGGFYKVGNLSVGVCDTPGDDYASPFAPQYPRWTPESGGGPSPGTISNGKDGAGPLASYPWSQN